MRQLQFGDVTIDRVVEQERFWADASWLYPGIDLEVVARHKANLGPLLVHPQTLQLCISFHSYLIRSGGRNILVDTCNGNHKHRPRALWQHQLASDTYLRSLAAFGLTPDDIDVVLCTHLHTDHVGWNTRMDNGRWVPTFPNARYLFSRQEFEHFLELHSSQPDLPVSQGSFADSVLPVVESGLAELVDFDHFVDGDLSHGTWIEDTSGHTPGHISVHVKGGGNEAIMTGDVFHHPIVFNEPSLKNTGDWRPDLAMRTRQRLMARCVDAPVTLLSMHFPSPTAGRLHSHHEGFRFQFFGT
ncbi:Beta-lactamase [Cupriavidus taiwanensis]|uniref:Beta-lactamase n=1 Tax=Cupriavidus taiwanensis TaxID=164546 RepID=A0A375D955_9BURK|nr:MBL fold metallo-hydrolase [Cupriavidus taiwanensis]SOY97463.1 Beta-lactamase [Cupriavidus taiwanensis]SOZ00193.1 Beta-lactamase [Cupriavidus taiwanensis]SPD68136.1 Beta-lactamase [Cupriavidus taiwanensis]